MTETEMTPAELTEHVTSMIATGALDKTLAEIERAIDARASSLRTVRTANDFDIGSTVRFNSHCGTAYLRGRTAVVVGKARTKLTVVLDSPVGRFVKVVDGISTSVDIKVPPSIIDPA